MNCNFYEGQVKIQLNKLSHLPIPSEAHPSLKPAYQHWTTTPKSSLHSESSLKDMQNQNTAATQLIVSSFGLQCLTSTWMTLLHPLWHKRHLTQTPHFSLHHRIMLAHYGGSYEPVPYSSRPPSSFPFPTPVSGLAGYACNQSKFQC